MLRVDTNPNQIYTSNSALTPGDLCKVYQSVLRRLDGYYGHTVYQAIDFDAIIENFCLALGSKSTDRADSLDQIIFHCDRLKKEFQSAQPTKVDEDITEISKPRIHPRVRQINPTLHVDSQHFCLSVGSALIHSGVFPFRHKYPESYRQMLVKLSSILTDCDITRFSNSLTDLGNYGLLSPAIGYFNISINGHLKSLAVNFVEIPIPAPLTVNDFFALSLANALSQRLYLFEKCRDEFIAAHTPF